MIEDVVGVRLLADDCCAQHARTHAGTHRGVGVEVLEAAREVAELVVLLAAVHELLVLQERREAEAVEADAEVLGPWPLGLHDVVIER